MATTTQTAQSTSLHKANPMAPRGDGETVGAGSRDRLRRAVATSGAGFDAQSQMLAPPAAPQTPAQLPSPAPAPTADPEVAAQAEDRAAFQDVDGATDEFTDVAKINSYFNDTCPQRWRSANPNTSAILKRCQVAGITSIQVNALVGYTGPGYAPMNRLTRGQMKSTYFKSAFSPYVAASTVALTKLNDGVKKNTQRGWRSIPGGDRDASVIENLYNREYVDEAGYMSTTLNSDQSMFAGPVSLQIQSTEGVNIKDFSLYPAEGEVLFKPGTRFKVKRFHKNGDVEAAWKTWHQDQSQPQPGKPWFEVDLEEP